MIPAISRDVRLNTVVLRRIGAWLITLSIIAFASPAAKGDELARYPSGANGKTEFVLRTADCKNDEDHCRLELVLIRDSKEQSVLDLPGKMPLPILAGPRVDEYGAILDYLLYPPHSESDTWASEGQQDEDAEEAATDAFELEVESIRLSLTSWGLLVTQSFQGPDYVSSVHRLYTVLQQKIVEVWGSDDNRMSRGTVSAVGAYRLSNHSPIDGMYLTTNYGESVLGIEKWTVSNYRWDPIANRVVPETTEVVPVFAAIVGSFTDATEAKTKLDRMSICGALFQVLKSDDFFALKPGFIIVASMQIGREAADLILKRSHECNPDISGYVRRAN